MKNIKKQLKIPKIDATTILTDNIMRIILTYLSIVRKSLDKNSLIYVDQPEFVGDGEKL